MMARQVARYFPSHSGTYRKADVPVIIGAGDMRDVSIGAPEFRHNNFTHSIVRLDGAQAEKVGSSIRPPDDWATYDVVFYWSNVSTATGNNVILLADVKIDAAGETLSGTIDVSQTKTVTSGSQDTLTRTVVASGLSVPARDSHVGFRFGRDGGSDAHTDEIDLVEVRLEKGS